MSNKQNDKYNEDVYEQAREILDQETDWVSEPGKLETFRSLPLEIRLRAIKDHNEKEIDKSWALNYNV